MPTVPLRIVLLVGIPWIHRRSNVCARCCLQRTRAVGDIISPMWVGLLSGWAFGERGGGGAQVCSGVLLSDFLYACVRIKRML